MRTFAIALFGLLTLGAFAQNKELTAKFCPVNPYQTKQKMIQSSNGLNGVFYIVKNNDGTMTMTRNCPNGRGYGTRVEFLNQTELVEAYSAPCGTDPNIRNNKGTYKVDKINNNTFKLVSTVDINKSGRMFQVVAENGGFTLKPIKQTVKAVKLTRAKQKITKAK